MELWSSARLVPASSRRAWKTLLSPSVSTISQVYPLGLLTPTAGEVIVSGENLSRLDDEKISAFRNRTIGFVWQSHYLLPEFTAAENTCPDTHACAPNASALVSYCRKLSSSALWPLSSNGKNDSQAY